MSMHRIPLTPLEEARLKAHGLTIGGPSQLSDVFRHGIKWAKEHSEDSPLHPEYIAGFKSGAYAARRRIELNPDTAPRVEIGQVTCPSCSTTFPAFTPNEDRLRKALTLIRESGWHTTIWMQQVAAHALEPDKWPEQPQQPHE